jgi:epoxyqueuosine reductase
MATSADKTLSILVRQKAIDLGFDLCGIAPSKNLKEHEPVIVDWCSRGMNGEMNYLSQNIEKRINPALLMPGARSVIVTGLNYFTGRKQGGDGVPVISRYAYGINYHDVIRERLEKILEYIKQVRPETEGRSFVDSAPILEKAWAREAGLGWPGRHSILVNKKIGSFFFLGLIVLNIELDYDKPFIEDLCGTCRLCIDSCPTGAINENKTIDVRKCISYLTIESKLPLPSDLVEKMDGRVFGCDRCQEVCPWNRNATQHKTTEFEISEELEKMTAEEWKALTANEFKRLFKGSAIERRKYIPFMRNVTIITNQT